MLNIKKDLIEEVLTQKDPMEGSFPGTKIGHGWMNNFLMLKQFYNSKANHYGVNCHSM